MGRIAGHYEWDDNELAPGQKKEGGLHQNLFDSDGKLKGSARFIPAQGGEFETIVVTETVYIPVGERRSTEEEEQFNEAISQMVNILIEIGIAAKPHVEEWWRQTAWPAIVARRAKHAERRALRRARKNAKDAAEPTHELVAAAGETRPLMSSAEAKARYLAALAARAYSDEQMRLVADAEIVDGENLEELERSLAELPPEQLKGLIHAMATNPALLGEENLAELASLLGRRALQ